MSCLFTLYEGIIFKPKVLTLDNFIAWLQLRFTDMYYGRKKTQMGPYGCQKH